MYEENLALDPPPDEATLWKYLDFAKFVSLLERRELHFARTDKLGDPFEGTYPKRSWTLAQRSGEGLAEIAKIYRSSILVDCWHQSDYESEAMWRLYADWRRGLAIQTTFLDMRESYIGPEPISAGSVRYIDYETDQIDLFSHLQPYRTKRRSFKHEQEVRALSDLTEIEDGRAISSGEEHAVGRYYRVDVNRLVNEVVVAPNAAPWFVDLVKAVTHQYGVSADVRKSLLAEPPPWAEPPAP